MLRIIALLLLVLSAGPVAAYVGPGAGITVLGSLFGILATIFVAIGALLFWPFRKLVRRIKAKKETDVSENSDISGTEK